MSTVTIQRVAVTALGASLATLGAIAPAQAATLNYTSTVSLFRTGTVNPLATSSFSFTKTDVAPTLFNYTVTQANVQIVPPLAALFNVPTSYTLNQLRANTTARNLILALNSTVPLPTQYNKYRVILPNVLNGVTPNYQGDGDFPPAGRLSYSFTQRQIPTRVSGVSSSTLAAIRLLFPQGGRVTFTSQLVTPPTPVARTAAFSVPAAPAPASFAIDSPTQTAAVPEPATLAGLALAGGGLAAIRRRRQKSAS
jgi:hypothetical protein